MLNYKPYSMANRSQSSSNVVKPAADHLAARQIITDLRRKTRQQCEQILNLQRSLATQQQQNRLDSLAKCEQLTCVANQLMMLESRLKRRQRQIAAVLRQREGTIARQQKTIDALVARLQEHGIPNNVMMDLHSGCEITFTTDMDSLNDSDSAVVLDEVDLDWSLTGVGCGGGSASDVTIVRSISDAIETSYKGYGTRRGSSFLRRPEILETVYSVEEDHDDAVPVVGDEKRESIDTVRSDPGVVALHHRDQEEMGTPRTHVHHHQQTHQHSPSITTHYNRVMSSNHRSVTKPKDVKYRRINKVKSKSLEELCGQLKQDGGDQSSKARANVDGVAVRAVMATRRLQHQASIMVAPAPPIRLPNQT